MTRHGTRTAAGCARATALALGALAFAALLGGPVAAEEGESMTVQGEVVDLACYLPRGDKGRGATHQECAEMCAKGGAPLGVLSADGTVALLIEDHARPAPYGQVRKLAGQQVEVQGKKYTRGGVTGLMVATVTQR